MKEYLTTAYHYISGNAPDPSKDTVIRHNVLAILYNPNNDQFAVLDWWTMNRKSRIMGWVDGQDIVTAAKREVQEEAGYIDLEYEMTLSGEVHAEYYASHKWVNRYSIEHCVVLKLISDHKHSDDLDDANHTLHRIAREQVEDFLLQIPWQSSNVVFRYEYTKQYDKLEYYLLKFQKVEKKELAV